MDQQEERPIARILEIPDQNTLKKVFNAEKQLLPKTGEFKIMGKETILYLCLAFGLSNKEIL